MNKKIFLELLHRAGSTSLKTDSGSIDFENDALVLITAAGQIVGTPLLDIESSDIKGTVAEGRYLNVVKAYEEVSKDHSVILLKDATLLTDSQRLHHEFLVIFTDEIIGVSFIANRD